MYEKISPLANDGKEIIWGIFFDLIIGVSQMNYRKFTIKKDAELAHNFLTRIVDDSRYYLPYCLMGANENPGWAQHCRVDDAELVASWYEALAPDMEKHRDGKRRDH